MALISLSEAREYLRVDSMDEENVIGSLLLSASLLARDVGRLTEATWAAVNAAPANEDSAELISLRTSLRIAILYALGYLFEHREEADHHDLVMTLRNLLFSVREGGMI